MKMHVMRMSLLTGAGLAALATAGPVFAQVEAQGMTGADSGLTEIIVTAQRRAERNQDVPIAITAFTPEVLARNNVNKVQDLNGLVPSLAVSSNGQGSRETQSPTIRGQGATFLAAPAVVVYLNEVPLPSAVSLSQQGGAGNFVDLENVQVLAGPQGTLFGRNTTGGAMLLVPKRPTNDLEGYLEGSIGNYDMRGLEGAINLPVINDKLMIRVVGAYQDRDGFTKDVLWDKRRDDLHWYSGRIGILMKPTERLTNYFMAYGSRSSTNGAGMVHNFFNIPGLKGSKFCYDPGEAAVGVPCAVYRHQTELAEELGPRKTRLGVDTFQYVRTWGLTNTTDLELNDQLTLRNIVSYQRLKSSYSYDGDGTPLQQYDNNGTVYPDFPVPGLAEYGIATGGYRNAANNPYPRDYIKQITEELQLQGKVLDDKLVFTLGGFYYNAKPVGTWGSYSLSFCPAGATGLCPPGVQLSRVANKSKALYAQATLNLGGLSPALDQLKLTAGYRYTWDTIDGLTRSYTPQAGGLTAKCFADAAIVSIADVAQCDFAATLKSKAPTWTIGLDYKPVDNLLLFAKVSRGYKAGGFNPFAVRPSTRVFTPERLTSYEVGFKWDEKLGGTPIRLNANYYYSDYSNIQRNTADFNPDTGASGSATLAASGHVQGFEAQATIKPASWLELGGSVSHTSAKYKDFSYTPLRAAAACNGIVPAGGTADLSCLPFNYVIPWIYNVHASVDLPIPEELGGLTFFASYSHQGRQPTSALTSEAVNPGSVFAAYGLLNLSLDWRDIAGSGFDVGLFMNNATNKLYKTSSVNVYPSLLVQASLYGEPRMYGIKLRYHFGQ